MRVFIRGLPALLAFVVTSTATAHHSFQATYTADKKIQVEGVVTDYSFRNPHVLVYVDVTSADGSVTNWMSEGAAANLLRRSGWSRDTLKTGDIVRVSGNATRDGSPMVSIDRIEVLDPQDLSTLRVLARQPGGPDQGPETKEYVSLPLRLADGRPNLSGAWIQNFAERRGPPGSDDPPPPFNQAGAARQAAFEPANDPQIFCDPPGLVRQAGFTPHPVRITQNEDSVLFEYEEYGGRRLIRLGDTLPATGERSPLGDSIAHYDGDRLIVETVNLLQNPTSPAGNYLSDRATTVEIYKRDDHPQYGPVLTIQTAVTDPGYLTDTWTMSRSKVFAKDYTFIENDCRKPLRERK